MKRRGFIAGLVTLPVVGGVIGRALGEPTPAAAAVAVEEEAELVLWEYLDHCSSWTETVERLREYVADGHPDQEAFTAVADAIERHAARGGDEPEGLLGLYPGVALMLSSLYHLRRYGSHHDHAAQVKLIRELTEEM
jgi:hypothetical protein